MLKVNEIFRSINGEGLLSGTPTVFVRLTGCNIRCSWCDTLYALKEGKMMREEEIVGKIKVLKESNDWILITGGEPLFQDIETLSWKLVDTFGYNLAIETNGTYHTDYLCAYDFISVDLKTPSSRTKVDFETLQEIIDDININKNYFGGQLKAVIADKFDYIWTRDIVEGVLYLKNVPLILQPAHKLLSYNDLINISLNNPLRVNNVHIMTQLHKLGGVR